MVYEVGWCMFILDPWSLVRITIGILAWGGVGSGWQSNQSEKVDISQVNNSCILNSNRKPWAKLSNLKFDSGIKVR